YLYFLITKLFHIRALHSSLVSHSELTSGRKQKKLLQRLNDLKLFNLVSFVPVNYNLRTDSEYSGRVQYDCGQNDCTLRITDLRESDSAEYKFRFTTNQPGGKYTGSPGVTLSVTGSVSEVNLASLEVRVKRQSSCLVHKCSESELTCHSSCPLPRPLSYVWYRNGHITTQESQSFKGYFYSKDVISCAVKNHEDSLSPSVYAPTVVSLTVSLSGVIMEGRSITLTCSSDANPAAKYRWYKEDQILVLKGPHLVLNNLRSSDSGQYHSSGCCILQRTSLCHDANPAANITWYKEGEDSPKASGQIFTITDLRPEHSGNYYCEVQNTRGRRRSALYLTFRICEFQDNDNDLYATRPDSMDYG
uniref:B-cell receptor CD22 n=1 Tax=Echeneis naucrates TaxID=173247 RepID=A0A665UE53_ECHNA